MHVSRRLQQFVLSDAALLLLYDVTSKASFDNISVSYAPVTSATRLQLDHAAKSKTNVKEAHGSTCFPLYVHKGIKMWDKVCMAKTRGPQGRQFEARSAETRLGLAIVPLCHGRGSPFDEHMRPLAPSW